MICCFVPTNRPGGLDILEASILRQTVKPTNVIVADELLRERFGEWSALTERLQDITNLYAFKPQQPIRNAARNLVAAYNQGVELARNEWYYGDDDLFISLQDYISVPEKGIERFMMLNILAPDALLTGVTNISLDPFPTEIEDLNGLYTIFKKPYYDQPKRIGWYDPRPADIYRIKENKITNIDPSHWEANWAAVPFKLFNLGARWSEIYDTGYAYENMDFAMKCQAEYGVQVLMDTDNVSTSLPHKEYWPSEVKDLVTYNNRELHERIWS